jgi:uncharacterized SAM-binding protein YcdF (DUF218 family)
MKRQLRLLMGVMLAIGVMAMPVLYHYSKGNLAWAAVPLPPKSHTDAVVVFTGDSDRAVKGYQFYLMGWAKRLMITGYDYTKEYKEEPKVRRLSKRADKDDVTIDLEATNTIENAENSAEWILKNGAKTVLLITNEDHMPRAFFELRRQLPESIKIYTNPTKGEIDHAGLDSEKGRLLCRMYETATGASFCYQTRQIIQALARPLG